MKVLYILIYSFLFLTIETNAATSGHGGGGHGGGCHGGGHGGSCHFGGGHGSGHFYDSGFRYKGGSCANNPAYWFKRGNTADEQENYREAIEDYTKAISLDSSYTEAWNYRGFSECLVNGYYDAIRDFDNAIKLDPDYATAYNNRGAVFEELNMAYAAEKDYTKALDLEPYNMRFKKNLRDAKEKFAAK
jgi:tetratricopeptide (TPR) repeat protein